MQSGAAPPNAFITFLHRADDFVDHLPKEADKPPRQVDMRWGITPLTDGENQNVSVKSESPYIQFTNGILPGAMVGQSESGTLTNLPKNLADITDMMEQVGNFLDALEQAKKEYDNDTKKQTQPALQNGTEKDVKRKWGDTSVRIHHWFSEPKTFYTKDVKGKYVAPGTKKDYEDFQNK